MKKNCKIVVIGNSVALRVRPPKEFPYNRNYSTVLEDLLAEDDPGRTYLVRNKGFSRLLISEVFENFDQYVQEFPDYYIINLGVVDASTREIPLWFANVIRSESNSLFHRFMKGLHYHIFKKHHSFFVKLRGKKAWISEKKFEQYYDRLFKDLKKETNARFIALSVNAGNERIEKKIPRSLKNYIRYSEIIKRVSAKHGATYINTFQLMEPADIPDGIHFSAKGHLKLAEALKNEILEQ